MRTPVADVIRSITHRFVLIGFRSSSSAAAQQPNQLKIRAQDNNIRNEYNNNNNRNIIKRIE
jgi:hypothetical protein